MDLRVHWLRFRESQEQFRFYWAPGHLNWGDYSTNHHPPIYHTNNCPRFAGYVNIFKKNKNINEEKDHLPDSRSFF